MDGDHQADALENVETLEDQSSLWVTKAVSLPQEDTDASPRGSTCLPRTHHLPPATSAVNSVRSMCPFTGAVNLTDVSRQEPEGPEWPDQGRKVQFAEGLYIDRELLEAWRNHGPHKMRQTRTAVASRERALELPKGRILVAFNVATGACG